jgi:hypothetical protein
VAAEAWLCIKTGGDTVLTAIVKKDEAATTAAPSLDQLADVVATPNKQKEGCGGFLGEAYTQELPAACGQRDEDVAVCQLHVEDS